MTSKYFDLRGKLSKRAVFSLELIGGLGLLGLWFLVAQLQWVNPLILPSPIKVLTCIPELINRQHLIGNLSYSIYLNMLAYVESVAIALPLGFLIGLIPIARHLTGRYVTALRYLPLTAAIGLYIQWFGLEATMKVQFLSTSITVYLVSSVILRIDAVSQVYIDTVKTCGASRWQTIASVFIPDVLSQVWDDIITLLPISWTYIIVVEVINMSDGGIGAVASTAARLSRVDMVYAVLILTMIVGLIQDKGSVLVGKLLFQHRFGRIMFLDRLKDWLFESTQAKEIKV